MGRWLDALRKDKNLQNAPKANPQNHQNPCTGSSEGFEGYRSMRFQKNNLEPGSAFDGFEGAPSGPFRIFTDFYGWDEEDWQFAFEERAAILEFDDGLSRPQAEAVAKEQIAGQRRRRLQ